MTADRIPDTPLFDRARQSGGYALNKATKDLRIPEKRDAFRANPGAYLDSYCVPDDAKRAVLARDWREMVRLGGNVFYILKLGAIQPATMTEIGAHQAGIEHATFLRERLGKR
ncbi:MAG: extradiol ring-cleavage dioxygenase [Proteobacteria bacterium]|nr:extradiol ring-cleavage dioxygenase [Pseudomonadota bacterium]